LKVLVLGGTRFIGRAVVADLAGAGHRVLVVHRGQTEPPDLPTASHAHADRHDRGAMRSILDDFAPDALIDTRALTAADAEAVLDLVPEGVRLAVLSSMDVYRAFGSVLWDEETDPVPIDEDSPVRGEDHQYLYRGQRPELEDYEKLDVEPRYLARDGVVLRLPMVYGEHDYQRREEFILRRVRAGRSRIPVGACSWLSCRGYVRDMAAGVRLSIESEAGAGRVLNLGETASWSAGLWARHILEAAGSDAELVQVPEELLPGDMEETKTIRQHLLVSAARARGLLGWDHSDPAAAVRASVRWHLANPPPDDDTDFSVDDRALATVA
jgi:nucleoside-diphosphate-sugar epimerase